MSASTFNSKARKYIKHVFKSFYGKNLPSKQFTQEEINKMLKASYMDGYNDCRSMYEPDINKIKEGYET